MVSSSSEVTAFGGWGGFTDGERDQFGPTFRLALKVGASSPFHKRVFTYKSQEGFRHIDGAWAYRTLRRAQSLLVSSDICPQARRGNWPNRFTSLGSRGKSCSSRQNSRGYFFWLEVTVSEPMPVFRFHHCDRVKEFFEDSLKTLDLDYIDLVSFPSHYEFHR